MPESAGLEDQKCRPEQKIFPRSSIENFPAVVQIKAPRLGIILGPSSLRAGRLASISGR